MAGSGVLSLNMLTFFFITAQKFQSISSPSAVSAEITDALALLTANKRSELFYVTKPRATSINLVSESSSKCRGTDRYRNIITIESVIGLVTSTLEDY